MSLGESEERKTVYHLPTHFMSLTPIIPRVPSENPTQNFDNFLISHDMRCSKILLSLFLEIKIIINGFSLILVI